MRAPSASRSRGSSVFTVAAVPTGMKTGVSTAPRAVARRPRRAAPSVARSSKRITAGGVTRAGRRVKARGASGASRAGGRHLLDERAPGAPAPSLRDDAQPDAPLDRAAGLVPADDGPGGGRE